MSCSKHNFSFYSSSKDKFNCIHNSCWLDDARVLKDEYKGFAKTLAVANLEYELNVYSELQNREHSEWVANEYNWKTVWN